jgi:uncharacterized membrane protein
MANINRNRVQSLDILRGTVMVIMALDHIRDFFYNPTGNLQSAALNPTAMATTFPALFFTRWITHFCAPIFVFLAGTSAYLMSQRKTKQEISAFLFKRGLWLVAVEVLIVTLGISFNPIYSALFLQVIWAIGCSMMILSVLIHLPYKVILGIGLIIVFLHNTLNFITLPKNFITDLLYTGLFSIYPIGTGRVIIILYALVPWAGIMILGYCFGKLYMPDISIDERKRKLLLYGFGLLGLFVVLRMINIYGDQVRWSVQTRGPVYTFLSFLNISKYPPSLDYFCVTIGVGMLALRLFEEMKNPFTRFMNVFGRVPFFYYVIHFYLIHGLLVVLFYMKGYTSKDIVNPASPFFFTPNGLGLSLVGVYIVWSLVIMIMYPLCKRYNAYKSVHHQWWLSYV